MAGTEHVISMEESLSKKVSFVREEAGETSRRRQSIEIEEEASSTSKIRKANLEKLKEAGPKITRNPDDPKTTPKIQEVPALLRGHRNFKKYFEPRVVSLGPIHHGKKEYQAAEDFKLGMACKFVEDSGKSGEVLLGKIAENIKQLKQYFDEKVAEKYDDETLAWMLFVDGCAVLQSIHSVVHQEIIKKLKIKNDQMGFAQQDLFLLENQLPYQLLLVLMDSSAKKEDLKESIETFMSRMAHERGEYVGKAGETNGTPIHLLDLLRTKLVGKSTTENKGRSNGLINSFKKLMTIFADLIPCKSKSGGEQEQSFRNVQELRAAGIYVKPAQTSLLTKISFDRSLKFFAGYLQLPLITVDDATGPKFFNLIAYEMCSDFDNDYGITSYVAFLDSLIDNPGDVKELRNAGILYNLLGSDEEVAQLFNEIGTDLVPDSAAYGDVKKKIQSHYRNQLKVWITQAIHEHFSSPWTILAFIAAILGLGLSAVQAFYAVKGDENKKQK
ncbi:hypothetical protein F2P56_009845 [Juglans regia]|uniref:Uncharacterized protein n=2 Tax=Juglans regia TaxID=51240 RepID=A0A833Y088_JUGRE|nr:UPF0481 protein At3g47200-like [Juglans regia]KAF5473220.1 hypothetical protein F2P56_009845 [Juglans regia]